MTTFYDKSKLLVDSFKLWAKENALSDSLDNFVSYLKMTELMDEKKLDEFLLNLLL